jgi:hypothetical protein
MDDSDMMARQDFIGAIAHMVEHDATLQSVVEQLRLCRLKLGSVLERLESLQLNKDDLEGIRGQSECITFEIDGLVVLLRHVMER